MPELNLDCVTQFDDNPAKPYLRPHGGNARLVDLDLNRHTVSIEKVLGLA